MGQGEPEQPTYACTQESSECVNWPEEAEGGGKEEEGKLGDE